MASKLKNSRLKNIDEIFRDRDEEITGWTCHYCPEVPTTIRQGAGVCLSHAVLLRKVGWS
ncbi:MAG TPA: hypothetical protein VF732_06455 [Nitrospira sp.]